MGIVERLRERANDSRDRVKPFNLMLDAAEEIERLQRELSETEALRAEGTAKIADLTLALSTARRTALFEAAEIAENFTRSGWIAHDIRVGIFPEQSRPGQAIAAEIRAKAEEA